MSVALLDKIEMVGAQGQTDPAAQAVMAGEGGDPADHVAGEGGMLMRAKRCRDGGVAAGM